MSEDQRPVGAHEPPLFTGDLPAAGGELGARPEDFLVDEVSAHPPEGIGDHLWVRIKKRGVTTPDAIDAVARAAAVPAREIGSAGMKDKHAITTQWLSLPKSARPTDTWALPEEIELLEQALHPKKLRTGQLAGNRFRIRLCNVPEGGLARAEVICERLRSQGLPNYFGAQRFGFGGANVSRALEWLASGGGRGGKRGRFYAKLYPSVVQSEIFNRYLTLRRELGLERLLEGEVVRLEGSGSVFMVEQPERELPRLVARDIHLTGPMPGPKMRRASGPALELEQQAMLAAGVGPALEEKLGRWVDGTRRDLLIWLRDLELSEPEPGVLELGFALPAGSYATELVRELTHAPFFSGRGR